MPTTRVWTCKTSGGKAPPKSPEEAKGQYLSEHHWAHPQEKAEVNMVTAITKQANCQSSNSTSKKKMALIGWTLGKKAKACLSTTRGLLRG